MPIEIVQQPTGTLRGYSVVPISFTVDSRYRVDAVDGGLGGWRLTEERVEPPYVKDYDDTDDERPVRWLRRWDISHWGVFAAVDDGVRIGGAVVAWNTPGADMLEGRDDLAVLWDLRVHPDRRRQGAGSRLFRRAAQWAARERVQAPQDRDPEHQRAGVQVLRWTGLLSRGHTPRHLRRAPPRGPAALVSQTLMESPAA